MRKNQQEFEVPEYHYRHLENPCDLRVGKDLLAVTPKYNYEEEKIIYNTSLKFKTFALPKTHSGRKHLSTQI